MNELEVNQQAVCHPGAESTSTPVARRVIAHKFGGSSLADADCFLRVAEIVRTADQSSQIVVVSAMRGVTDELIHLATVAASGERSWRERWETLRDRHLRCAEQLLGDDAEQLVWLDAEFAELAKLLGALSVLRTASDEVVDRIQGLGEIYSAHLLQAFLRSGGEWALLDAREVLVVRRSPLGSNVEWEASRAKLATWREKNRESRVVVTGYVAQLENGRATTLGRNGSDYSGAIFAALFEAAELHIWTDVDGVLSADPRIVPEAVTLSHLSYEEACELAYFGAKVLHPQTMTPAIERGVPIYIRNTFEPEKPGTRIAAASSEGGPVAGLTLCSDLAIVNVEGSGMIGVPGTAERLFAALRAADVSVMMISQGSSEHSICCIVREAEALRAKDALEHAFARELASAEVESIQLLRNISVLAAVGDGMAGTPGVAAQLFATLARARVNVRAIAQGSSERNISVAIATPDAPKALRAAHSGFWLSPQTLSIGVIGPGRVGAALLDQLQAATHRLRVDSRIDLRLRAIADSKRMSLSDQGATDWRDALVVDAEAHDLDRFSHHLQASHLPYAVLIDCSASDAVADRYSEWLAAGIHVITPNKHAGAGSLSRYRAIRAASTATRANFRYEATVGAGLPIIQTLRDLLDTGDELYAVDGILSGTMAWLFNEFDGTTPFSQLVLEARRRGYTEPDPREDLAGIDVARKLVILAREAGKEIELGDVVVESLVPPQLRATTADEFSKRLAELDPDMQARFERAHAAGRVLRYVAHLGDDGPRVGLSELPLDHSFARLRSTDNVVQFTTRRYSDNPLVVQGPGAGPEVTAAGVFADLLRVAAGVGAQA